MKRKSTRPGGRAQRPASKRSARPRQRSGKICRKKETGWLSKARAEWATGKRGKLTTRRLGRDAVYDDLLSEELCWDLAGRFARESARRTRNAVGEIADRYEAIASEFVAARYQE